MRQEAPEKKTRHVTFDAKDIHVQESYMKRYDVENQCAADGGANMQQHAAARRRAAEICDG